MPVLKSETRIKEIDTSQPQTDASEYAEGDVVYDQTDGLIRHNGSSFEGVQVGKGLFINTGIKESVIKNNATSFDLTDYDCSAGQIFYGYATGLENWRVNLINFELPDNSGTNITIIVAQDSTPAIPVQLTISSTGTRSGYIRNIQWMDDTVPTPTPSGMDVFSFTIFRLTGGEVVLGQMVPFGWG